MTVKCLIKRLRRKGKPSAVPSQGQRETFSETSCSIEPSFDLPQWQWEENLPKTIGTLSQPSRNSRRLPHSPANRCAQTRSASAATVVARLSEPRSPDDPTTKQSDSPRKIDAATLVRLGFRRSKLNVNESRLLAAARAEWEAVDSAVPLVEEFVKLVRGASEGKLSQWIVRANATKIKELKSFANGVQRDFLAVKEALVSEWSNGQTEGQVNRLKLIKRAMYGRAKFDLLRARVLHRI